MKNLLKRIFGNMWKKEKYFKKMIYHTEMYDEIYDLTIHKKDFFFMLGIWKDSDVKFLINRVIDLCILVIQ